MKKMLIVACVGASLLCFGCGQNESTSRDMSDPADPQNSYLTASPQQAGFKSEQPNRDVVTGAINYGFGVYYFPSAGAEFANSLAIFLSRNKGLEVTSVAPNVVRRSRYDNHLVSQSQVFDSDYGVAVGYFVTFRQKEKL